MKRYLTISLSVVLVLLASNTFITVQVKPDCLEQLSKNPDGTYSGSVNDCVTGGLREGWLDKLLPDLGVSTPKLGSTERVTLDTAQTIEWDKPTTDAGWAEDVKTESLHVKFTEQLEEMQTAHTEKLKRMLAGKSDVFECPECIRFQARKNTPEWSDQDVETYYQNELSQALWEVEKLEQSIERIDNELRLRKSGYLQVLEKDPRDKKFDPRANEFRNTNQAGSRVRTPLGTTYYIDFNCHLTATCGNGLATTTSFSGLDEFTEAARSAGDIAFVRRDVASTTAISDVNFTSDGTIANPIIITADYDNLWGDFATSSQTYTLAIATSTFTASASSTDIVAGDWVYAAGDCFETYNSTSLNQCEFAYEVASISGTNLTLFLPYKGNQSGAGISLRILGKNPQWNTATGDFQWNFDTDDYWLVKGMDIRGTDANGQVEIDSSSGHAFIQSIFTGNSSDTAIAVSDDESRVFLTSTRFATGNVSWFLIASAADANTKLFLLNVYIIAGTFSDVGGYGGSTVLAQESYGVAASFGAGQGTLLCINCQQINGQNNVFGPSNALNALTLAQDYDGIIGDNREAWFEAFASSDPDTTSLGLVSTSTLRSGGGPTATEVRPTTNTTSIWDFNKIKLFEYPIYTDTSSKQYDVYFRVGTSTTQFTTDPTASELWIQCEYWAHQTGATSTRKVKKSTGTIDFNGSSNWQNLSVTCQPTQSGIMYLSGYYAKTLESGKTNVFLMDNTPVIQ